MDLFTAGLIVLLIIALAYLFWVRKKARDDAESPQPREQSKNTSFHAVSIKYSSNACSAAKDMSGRRFLASAAPKLPLPDCDVLECNCRFAHHADRRTGKDRRSPFAPSGLGGGTGSYEHEQRKGGDRRRNDD